MTKILLVEDDKSLREIYGVRLLAEGYQIASAGDGEEALAMAVKERPDLIISDVMMPKISGFDMLDILRSTPETKEIKVIMMTALSSEDQRSRGEALGANRYLVKSQVGIEDVVRTVHDVLADSPIAVVPNVQLFGTPTLSAAQQPQSTPAAAPVAPVSQIPTTPAPTPMMPQSQAPVMTATSVQTSAPTMQPMEPTTTQEPTQQIAPSQLPQPTAPFSTQSPTPLGDRTINPMQTTAATDIATLISQELNGTSMTPPPTPQI